MNSLQFILTVVKKLLSYIPIFSSKYGVLASKPKNVVVM